MKQFWSNKGFTLVEALVTVSVIGVTGFILSDLLLRSFRGNNKTQLISSIKQNAQSALNIMDLTLRFASPVICSTYDSANRSIIVAQKQDNRYVRFIMYPPAPSNNPTTNGYIQQDAPSAIGLDTNTRLCDLTMVPVSSQSSPLIITNQDPRTGISIINSASSFIVTSNPGTKDIVTISFRVKPGISLGKGFENEIGDPQGILFETSVVLR